MTASTVDVADIRFTQEHVYDTFNANSSKAGTMMELMNDILNGDKTPADLPLIRVAQKRGAYWCVDNRRLFVYKHLQLGPIPVQVFNWNDNREFALKYRNGLPTRAQTGDGRRAGLIQRGSTPLPRSPIAEPSLSHIRKYMSSKEQSRHEARIMKLRASRESDSKPEIAQEHALRELFPVLKKKKTKRKQCRISGSGNVEGKPKRRKKVHADLKLDHCEGSSVTQKPKLIDVAHTTASTLRSTASTAFTVTMEQEDSGDEAFSVEVFTPN